jgi:flagellar hook-associated protein 2
MGLAFPGVYSGIDTETIIAQLMAINRRPLNRLEARKELWQDKGEAVAEIESRLVDMRGLVVSLRDSESLRRMTASTSDSGVLTASAGTGAAEGTHAITVNRLASAEREIHDGVATLDTLVGEGAFSYIYDGITTTLYTTAETTLEDLCDQINNEGASRGLSASILEYEDDPEHVYHLVLSGSDSGSDYTITINDAETTLDGTGGTIDFREASFDEVQSAEDCQVKVDGYPSGPGNWIERSSNTISDLIAGVTLSLKGVGTASVTLNRDTAALKNDLQNLANIYNGIAAKLDEYTGYDAETQTGGILQGDATLNGILYQIRSLLVGPAAGFVDGKDSFVLPAHIGLEIGKGSVTFDSEGNAAFHEGAYGVLTLDEAALDDALTEDYLGVLSLIGAQRTGSSDDTHVRFTSALSTTTPGVYEVEVDFDAAGVITDARVRTKGESEWRSLTIDGNQLTGPAGNPEAGLLLTAVWAGVPETRSAEVQLRQGFAGALYDRLDDVLDASSGSITLRKENISSTIDGIDKNIEYQQTRLDKTEERLRAQYARLEATLSRLDSLNAAFQSLFQQLAGSNSSRTTS